MKGRTWAILAVLAMASVSGLGVEDAKTVVKPTPLFSDLPWGSTYSAFDAALDKLGFTIDEKYSKEDESGKFYMYEGTMVGYPALCFGVFGLGDVGMMKVQVCLLTPDEKARDVYFEMKDMLKAKYGNPRTSYESSRDETLASFWGSAMMLKISERKNVEVTYESPKWQAVATRKREAKKESQKKAF